MKKRRILSILLACSLTFSGFSALGITACAKADEENGHIDILVEHGYSRESAEVLPVEAQLELAERLIVDPDSVSISTVAFEVDMLLPKAITDRKPCQGE